MRNENNHCTCHLFRTISKIKLLLMFEALSAERAGEETHAVGQRPLNYATRWRGEGQSFIQSAGARLVLTVGIL